MRFRALFMTGMLALAPSLPALAQKADKSPPGKAVAFSQDKGNCLSCHGFPSLTDAEQTGNSGPPIIAMQARFPDRAALRARIWDASAGNAASFMPPFGRHRILTEEEIDQVVDFLLGL
jgi:sulfur-oxidizing protein SoxX